MLPASANQPVLFAFVALGLFLAFSVWDARRGKRQPDAKSYIWFVAAATLACCAFATWQLGSVVTGWLLALAALANLVTGIRVWLKANRQHDDA